MCTRRGDTVKHVLKVSNTFTFNAGLLTGGGVVRPDGMAFKEFPADPPRVEAAGLEIRDNPVSMGSDTIMYGGRGAWISIEDGGSWGVSGRALLGGYGARVVSSADSTLRITGEGVAQWAIHSTGTVRCNGYGNAAGGGDLSQATVVLASSASRFVLNGRSVALRTPPVDVVALAADAPVVREDVEYAKERTAGLAEGPCFERDRVGEAVPGNYRLAGGRLESAWGALDDGILAETSAYVIDFGGGDLLAPAEGSYRLEMDGDATACVPWHASAREVQDAIAALPAAAALGGPTVSRRGDGGRRWRFGFHYEVAWDRAEDDAVTGLSLSCLGSSGNCGCADAVSRQATAPTGACRLGVARSVEIKMFRIRSPYGPF